MKINYDPTWEAIKNKVLDRDNYTCQNCGKTTFDNQKDLNIHHIIPQRLFVDDCGQANYNKANAMDNLISYCDTCFPMIQKETDVIIAAMGDMTAKVLYNTK